MASASDRVVDCQLGIEVALRKLDDTNNTIMLKKGILVCCIFSLGAVLAQEEELERSSSSSMEEIVPPPAPPIYQPEPGRPISPNEVIEFPEVEAQFPGGMEALQKYIQDNVKYPEVDRQLGTEGRVYMTFVVERDGSITGVQCMRKGVSPTINREAARLVETMPLWIPAEDDGKKVRARCRLPITFSLSSGEDPK